ncbi:MAG: hypothetical protein PHO23_03405 [Candidatus Pacebacteria bacterium]|nr:hypothetical protein [Candidatus Paceibacterota bacterium]
MYTVDNIPLSVLTTDPRGISAKAEEICEGGAGVDKQVEDSRTHFVNKDIGQGINPSNSKTETEKLKTIQHLKDYKQIPLT